MNNRKTYESSDVSSKYSASTYLHEPEKAILHMLGAKLKKMKMLDIGVGGGRTSYHFLNSAKEYVGIDYSSKMIEACKKRFKNSNNASFILCDAGDMSIFNDNCFDFILVSSNALDYVSNSHRIKAFKEIKRVGKKNGYLLFSSHNLMSIDRLLKIGFTM